MGCQSYLFGGPIHFFKELPLVIKIEPSGLVREFIDFAQSSPGRKIIEESGSLSIMDKIGV